MCHHPERDECGRMLKGYTANPSGRPVRKPFLRLLEAAEAVGARVVIEVPTRRQRAAKTAPGFPPEAA
jgi:hypothetical protein